MKLAVLQQQQHLLATAPQLIPLVLEVADGPEICTDCLKSKEIDGMMEGTTQKSLTELYGRIATKTEKKRPS